MRDTETTIEHNRVLRQLREDLICLIRDTLTGSMNPMFAFTTLDHLKTRVSKQR